MKKYDVIIIGAGAAGLMAAIEAGKRSRKVLVLEKSEKAGKKILISGGGRCNFTNMFTSADDYLSGNPHFCKSALARYSPWDFISLMEKHQLSWTEKTLGQLFCDQKAPAIVSMLLKECKSAQVTIELNTEIKSINKQQNHFIINSNANEFEAESLIIATGGPSIPAMGATDFSIQLAKQFSLKTIPFSAALVPFTVNMDKQYAFIKELSGLSQFVELSTNDTSFQEAILFTHRGISGPAALQVSSYWKPNKSIQIDFFPHEDIAVWLQEQQQDHPQAELKTVLSYKMPKRLAHSVCENILSDEFNNKPIKQLSQQDIENIANQLSHWQLTPKGTEGFRTAEVSLGGIETAELSSKTLECNSVKGLYFIGESVDVTGHLGGFNFQWAWASGWCAGQYA